jgi:hypothetical protein
MGLALLVLLCDGEVPVSLEERKDVWGTKGHKETTQGRQIGL